MVRVYCYFQNLTVMNRVIKRSVCIMFLFISCKHRTEQGNRADLKKFSVCRHTTDPPKFALPKKFY